MFKLPYGTEISGSFGAKVVHEPKSIVFHMSQIQTRRDERRVYERMDDHLPTALSGSERERSDTGG